MTELAAASCRCCQVPNQQAHDDALVATSTVVKYGGLSLRRQSLCQMETFSLSLPCETRVPRFPIWVMYTYT